MFHPIPKPLPSCIALLLLAVLASPLFADSWPFTPLPDKFAPDAALDLRPMNEKIAGNTGFITRTNDGDDFALPDGQPIRFWAVNDYNGDLPMDQLEHHARWLAKRGVNMVRMHMQISPDKGQPFLDANPKELDRIFKTVAAMKKEGIYSTISPYWAYVKIPAAWQIPGVGGGENDQQAWGLLFWDPRLQQGYKAWTKKLLTTPNPYTGIPLAKDPAVAILQIQNEDSMLFWTMQRIKGVQLDNLRRKFADFLIKKYGSLDAAKAAWPKAHLPDDNFAKNLPALYITWELTLPQTGDKQKRIADQTQFLGETMKNFNAMIADYFRNDLGCRQLINAGNWQTASPTRLYDVERYAYTANEVIGANRYFSGVHLGEKAGWAIDKTDHYTNASVLKDPRALPLNIRQVAGFPTIIPESQWVNPDLYQSEGPFLVAAYSSLTGVDTLYWFADGDGAEWQQPFRDPVGYWHPPMSKWDVATPMQLGQFPAAALIFRNHYLKQADPVIQEVRTLQQLWNRELPLIAEDQSYDPNRNVGDSATKSAALSADPLAFLVGPVTVSYVDPTNQKSKMGGGKNQKSLDLSPFINHTTHTITSATKEITLNYSAGLCTINAPCAQGAAGFLKGAGPIHLADVSLTVQNDYATILLVSLDKLPLAQSKKILLQIGTTQRPTNWKDHPADFPGEDKKETHHGFQIDSTGQNPWQIESAQGTLTLTNPHLTHATLLDPNLTPTTPVPLTRKGATVTLTLPEKSLYAVLSD